MTAAATPARSRGDGNPYVGPRAFQYGERIYGRNREVLDLLDLLIAERITLLHSPSGAGKTSLVQAGLVPRLEREGFHVLPVTRVGLEPPPGLRSPRAPNRYLLSVLLSLEQGLPADRQLRLGELVELDLADYLRRRPVDDDRADGEVLILDQFEELLVLDPTDQAAKAAFLTQLGEVLRDRRRWALFAMREDWIGGLDPYVRWLPTRLSTTLRLDFLGEAAARSAIQSPAIDAGVTFSDAAASKLVDDLRRIRVQRPDGVTEEPGPYVETGQLQVVCRRLWERLPPGATEIERSHVEAVGDVDSALADYYVERVRAIAGETGTGEDAIREWFDRQLITEQGFRAQVLRGPAGDGETGEEVLRLELPWVFSRVDRLGDARVVDVDSGEQAAQVRVELLLRERPVLEPHVGVPDDLAVARIPPELREPERVVELAEDSQHGFHVRVVRRAVRVADRAELDEPTVELERDPDLVVPVEEAESHQEHRPVGRDEVLEILRLDELLQLLDGHAGLPSAAA